MNFKVDLPQDIPATCFIMLYLEKEDLTLSDTILSGKQNSNFLIKHTTTFDIHKRQEIAMFMTFNEGTEKFDVKNQIQ